jgi:hypothetical protein
MVETTTATNPVVKLTAPPVNNGALALVVLVVVFVVVVVVVVLVVLVELAEDPPSTFRLVLADSLVKSSSNIKLWKDQWENRGVGYLVNYMCHSIF